ncbi:MAG TPA: tetratricopeptide repeat protein [Bacteroidales bacterium]|nr:tetratricopeptide repeat protein [Bacteroidales bacterium]
MKQRSILALLTLVIFGFSSFAQDINSAIETFNEGNQALQGGNLEMAIEKYKTAKDVAATLGAEGNDIVAAAKKQIPTLYYQLGVQDYRDKNFEKAISEFQNAITFGEEFEDSETVQKAKDIVPKLYNSLGNDFFKEGNHEEALANFNKAVELDPNYSRAYWGQGLVLNKMGKDEEMNIAFNKAKELAAAEGDEALVERINTTGQKFFKADGIRLLQAQDWNGALKALEASNKYKADDPDTYYYIALAYNGLGNWEKAIESAKAGLELANGEPNDVKAKFYFEMGNAYKGAGNNTNACEAYNNAKYGKFVENANYEITTVLKCN